MTKFRTVIVLYLLSTLCAAIVSVFSSFLFPITVPLAGLDAVDASAAPQGMAEVVMNLLKNFIANPVDALAKANYIGILFWAVVIGVALKLASGSTKSMMAIFLSIVATFSACGTSGVGTDR